MEPEVKTERDKYIEGLEAKIRRAGKARRFLEDADGSLVTEWAQEQINSTLKRIGGVTYKDDHQGYVYELGGLHKLQALLAMLNKDASQDTKVLQEQLKEAKTDG